MSMDITRGNVFITHLVNHICFFEIKLILDSRCPGSAFFIQDNLQIFHCIKIYKLLTLLNKQ